MNKTYNLVYNEELGAWVAVSEITKAKGKKKKASVAIALSLLSLLNAAHAQVIIGTVNSAGVLSTGTASALADTATQNGGVAIGGHSTASAIQTIAIGGATASAKSAIAIGWASVASQGQGVVLGAYSTAGNQGVALGANVTATGYGSIGIGGDDIKPLWGSSIGGIATVPSVYSSTLASGDASVANGTGSTASTAGAVAVGAMATASGVTGTAVGLYAQATNDYSVALGAGSSAFGVDSTAVGVGSGATSLGASAFGFGAKAMPTKQLRLGTFHQQRPWTASPLVTARHPAVKTQLRSV